jgi:hypothetical protein
MFSFGFLDILATTIGVLIFIMLFAALSHSGAPEVMELLAQEDELEQELQAAHQQVEQARREHENAKKATAKAREALGQEASSIDRQAADLEEENEDILHDIEDARRESDRLERQLEGLEDEPAGPAVVPRARKKSRVVPYHVDCRESGLVLLGPNMEYRGNNRLRVKVGNIDDNHGSYRRLLNRIKRRGRGPNRGVLVLWVRPDGVKAADEAIKEAQDMGVSVGWEPADSDWAF